MYLTYDILEQAEKTIQKVLEKEKLTRFSVLYYYIDDEESARVETQFHLQDAYEFVCDKIDEIEEWTERQKRIAMEKARGEYRCIGSRRRDSCPRCWMSTPDALPTLEKWKENIEEHQMELYFAGESRTAGKLYSVAEDEPLPSPSFKLQYTGKRYELVSFEEIQVKQFKIIDEDTEEIVSRFTAANELPRKYKTPNGFEKDFCAFGAFTNEVLGTYRIVNINSDNSLKEMLDNINSGMTSVCKDCKKLFWMSRLNQSWYTERGLALPKRCVCCREKRKQNK